jgi:tellurite resistance protein
MMITESINDMKAIPDTQTDKSDLVVTLQYLPVGLFGETVAISALSIEWHQAVALFAVTPAMSVGIGIIAVAIFILLIALYLLKIIKYPVNVKTELNSPVFGNFAGTFFISTVLIATIVIPFSLTLGRVIWLVGTAGGFGFMCLLTARMFNGNINIRNALPPILIPGLVVLNAATSGAAMQFGWWGKEVDLILFSFGIMLVFSLFAITLYRLMYLEKIDTFFQPTLLLMSAPFEVGFLAYVSRSKTIDTFASVIFFFGLLIFTVIFFKVFKKGLSFMISWWAASFSLAALANASLEYAIVGHDPLLKDIAGFLLVGSSVMVAVTLSFTLSRHFSSKLLHP